MKAEKVFCGRCGGQGFYRVVLKQERGWELIPCEDCNGKGYGVSITGFQACDNMLAGSEGIHFATTRHKLRQTGSIDIPAYYYCVHGSHPGEYTPNGERIIEALDLQRDLGMRFAGSIWNDGVVGGGNSAADFKLIDFSKRKIDKPNRKKMLGGQRCS